jgi:uncharacterized protein
VRSIRERLNAMQPEVTESPEPAAAEPPGVPIDLVTPGCERQTHSGSHFLVKTSVPAPDADYSSWPASLKRVVDASVNHEDILFLDTETTGLDRGTGTHVFLIGLGYFSGDEFHVEQHFLRDLHEEPSMLADINDTLRDHAVLVTFNGRGFDWPMITTRLILHGFRDLPELPHWDLLTSSRRVWRNRLRDCSLGSLERRILNIQRYGDVPGYMIPDLYFDYLRTRDARPLKPVFSHNQEDIVSLARLADILLCAERDPVTSLNHPVDQVSFGLYLLNHGDLERADALIRPNLDAADLEPDLRFRSMSLLAQEYRRRIKLSHSIAIWELMLGYRWQHVDHYLHPLVELAKVHEHRLRDFNTAIRYTERALNLIELHGGRGKRDELNHRYARLRRRMMNQST